MASENTMNDFHQSDKPILCANGCGFFGTPATMNLCSKCYRDHRLHEEQAASARAAVEKSMTMTPKSPPPVTLVVDRKSTPAPEGPSQPAPEKKAANCCEKCQKKLRVMAIFKCKCGRTFCGSHRYPEGHECTFDHKGFGKEAIAKANPIVKADKIERF